MIFSIIYLDSIYSVWPIHKHLNKIKQEAQLILALMWGVLILVFLSKRDITTSSNM